MTIVFIGDIHRQWPYVARGLDATGSPPTAAELLLRHAGPHGLDAMLILFRDWEHWSA